MNNTCECSDPECKGHPGKSECLRKAKRKVSRYDYETKGLSKETRLAMQWKVYRGKRFIGIIESNFLWASRYWTPKGYRLVQVTE